MNHIIHHEEGKHSKATVLCFLHGKSMKVYSSSSLKKCLVWKPLKCREKSLQRGQAVARKRLPFATYSDVVCQKEQLHIDGIQHLHVLNEPPFLFALLALWPPGKYKKHYQISLKCSCSKKWNERSLNQEQQLEQCHVLPLRSPMIIPNG